MNPIKKAWIIFYTEFFIPRGDKRVRQLMTWEGNRIYEKQWTWGRFHFKFTMQSKHSCWGRFGGGWDWKLGFQIGSTTVIFNLLIAMLRIAYKREESK